MMPNVEHASAEIRATAERMDRTRRARALARALRLRLRISDALPLGHVLAVDGGSNDEVLAAWIVRVWGEEGEGETASESIRLEASLRRRLAAFFDEA